MQSTNTVLMVSPDHFGFNSQTKETNSFQNEIQVDDDVAMRAKVRAEFESLQEALRSNNVNVVILSSRSDVCTPDAVFPNNWFSIHAASPTGCELVLYPMLNENRQAERQPAPLTTQLRAQCGIELTSTIDLTHWERTGRALEGTGSMVLDRINKVSYASISLRTDIDILNEFCERLGYTSVAFTSSSDGGVIYHTNVIMSIGTRFAVVCKESIKNADEAEKVVGSLSASGREVICISLEQLNYMCGNILELTSSTNETVIAMSTTARNGFTEEQRNQLSQFGKIVHADINTIESVGGGSVRCMLAEIFLPH
jgi:hypothetical protein